MNGATGAYRPVICGDAVGSSGALDYCQIDSASGEAAEPEESESLLKAKSAVDARRLLK